MNLDLDRIDALDLDGPEKLLRQRLMSPFVWRPRDGGYALLVRAVPQPEDDDPVTGRIWHGRGDDGLRFRMDDAPLIEPGPGPLDSGGCEDPTAVPTDHGFLVYYTGLDERRDGQMLYVAGPDIGHLEKRGVAHAASKTERNTKEAAVERTGDGEWRLFYEYSQDCRSKVGLGVGVGPAGPWDELPDPFEAREDGWDSWHLSSGPLLMCDPDRPVMFYNGADRDAAWGIGWIAFSRDLKRVLARCDRPIIGPPDERGPAGRRIAFAASVLADADDICLYFSRDDRWLRRAILRRSSAGGAGPQGRG